MDSENLQDGIFHAYLVNEDLDLGTGEGLNVHLYTGDKTFFDGTTVQIAATGNTFESPSFIQAIEEGLLTPLATSVVEIQSIWDLPSPVNGVISLPHQGVYRVRGLIDLGTNTLWASSESILLGYTGAQDGFVTANTNPLLVVEDGSLYGLRNLILKNTLGPALYYNGNGTGIPVLTRVGLLGAQPSTFENCDHIKLQNVYLLGDVQGLRFTGTNKHLDILGSGFQQATDPNLIWLDFVAGCSFESISILQSGFDVIGTQIAIRQDAGAILEKARVTHSNFTGVGVYLDGFTQASLDWDFLQNVGIQNSAVQLAASWASLTPVNFSSPGLNTYGIVPGVMAVSFSERMIETTPGSSIFRFVGKAPTTITVNATVAVSSVGSTSVIMAGIAYNGTVMAPTEVSISVAAGGNAGAVIPLSFAMHVQPGDEGAIHLKNTSNTNDINVFSVSLSAFGSP